MESIPLYRQIVCDLKMKINSGIYSEGDTIPSEAMLERDYQVSRITARRALDELANMGLVNRVKGGGTYVKKREKPISSIQQRPKTVGMLIPFDSSEGGNEQIITGASDYLSKMGYTLSILNCHRNRNQEDLDLESVHKNLQGLICRPYSVQFSSEHLYMVYNSGFPICVVDCRWPGMGIPSVTSDNFQGAYDITEYLLERGHTRICFVSDSPVTYHSSIRDRFLGYCAALRKWGIEITADYAETNLTDYHQAAVNLMGTHEYLLEMFKQLLRHQMNCKSAPTAIVALNDMLANDVMQAMISLNIRVPDEMSIVGFDNLPFLDRLAVKLTTVEQNFYQMGYQSAKMVMEEINGEAVSDMNIPTRLILRNSVRDFHREIKEVQSE